MAGCPDARTVRPIRAAADLIEQAGIDDLALCPSSCGEIVIQVPGRCGDTAARIAKVAALTGCEPVPVHQPHVSRSRSG